MIFRDQTQRTKQPDSAHWFRACVCREDQGCWELVAAGQDCFDEEYTM